MAVDLKIKRRGNRGVGHDRMVHAYADLLLDQQAQGRVAPMTIASALNAAGIPSPYGREWSVEGVRRMVKKGLRLGYLFERMTCADASAQPRLSKEERELWLANKKGKRVARALHEAARKGDRFPTDVDVISPEVSAR